MALVEGTYKYKVADKELKSNSGESISPGDTYFLNEEGNSILTLNEGEIELLGLRDVSTEERKSLAKKGSALKSGAFPMKNCSDVANAIHAIGRAKPGERGSVRSLIRRRVKALGCSGSVFDNWK